MSTSTIILIVMGVIFAGFIIYRFKKGKWQEEKDILGLLVIIFCLIAGLVQVEIKYEAIHNIETNMKKIKTKMETIQANIAIDKSNISTMERNILNVEKHISEMEENILKVEENVKKIAHATAGISRGNKGTTINEPLRVIVGP